MRSPGCGCSNFDVTGYTLNGATLTATQSYPNTTTGYETVAPEIGVGTGHTATIACPVAASHGLRKTRGGTLVLD